MIGVLISVTLLFTGIGIFYSKGKIEGPDDFFTARNSAGVGFLSTTFMASFLGVFILFTPPEAGAIGGITTVILYALGLLSLYLAFLFLGPKIRTYLPEGSTLNDFVKKRYGKKMFFLTFSVSIFYMVVHLIAELTAIALVAKEIAGIPMLFTALLVGLCVMIYTSYGGLKASMFTDLIQMTLVIILLVVVGFGIYSFIGGPSEILSKAKNAAPTLMSFKNKGGIEFGLTLMIAVFVANLFHQGYWQRIYASKDSKGLKKSLKISLVLAVPIMMMTGLLGVVSVAYNHLEHPSTALFSLIYATFPLGLILIVFILALILVMSTVDTLLNALVTSIAVDTGHIKQSKKSHQTGFWIKSLGLLIILPSALIASKGFSVLYLFLLADLLCAGLVFPLFFGLYNKRLSQGVAIIASLSGILTGLPFFLANKMLLAFILPIVVSMVLVFVGMVIESKFMKTKTLHKLDQAN
jgi:Na+/proline symporter